MQKLLPNTKGFGLFAVLAIVVVVAVLGGAGAYVYHRDHKAKAVVKTTTSQKTTSKSSATPTKPVVVASPYAGWQQYCSAQEKSCFKYPADWTTKSIGAADPAGDGIQLTSPNGTVIWFQSAVSGLGGECQPSTPDVINHKVIAVPAVANLYIVESGTKSTINHIGLVNGTDGQAPATGDTGSCISETTFISKHDPSMYAWLESNGTSNFNQSDLSTAELIMESYSY
jgi:hypothetical protein